MPFAMDEAIKPKGLTEVTIVAEAAAEKERMAAAIAVVFKC